MSRISMFVMVWALLAICGYGQTITTDKSTYSPGEPMTVVYDGATTAKDWIGLYTTTTTPGPSNSLAWLYLNGSRTAPGAVVAQGTVSFTAPSTAGSYKVCFHPDDGYTVGATVQFSVSAVLSAGFCVSFTTILAGGTTTFLDLSTNAPTAWSWTFAGGTPSSSTMQQPVVTYATAGTYDVTLAVSNAQGNSTVTKTGCVKVIDPGAPMELAFMAFNIWYEGTRVPDGMTHIRNIVASVNPDFLMLSEVSNQAATTIVNNLSSIGQTYHKGFIANNDVAIISKYPFVSTGPLVGSRISVFTVDVHGVEIVVAAAHLDYTHYACYLPRGYNCGGTAPYASWDQIGSPDPQPVTDPVIISDQNMRSQRDEQMGAFLTHVHNEVRPVVLLGDFNEPSCQDWTARQANLFDHNGVVFQWQTTLSIITSGFTDAYRHIYPDEVSNPGITWPAVATGTGSTSWAPRADERDRIDYIFYRGTDVRAASAAIVGPPGSYVRNVADMTHNGNDTFLAHNLPWPSDHKAVYATIVFPGAAVAVSAEQPPDNRSVLTGLSPVHGTTLNLVASHDTEARFTVIGITGRLVTAGRLRLVSRKMAPIDLSVLPAGVYLVRVHTQTGAHAFRFVKN